MGENTFIKIEKYYGSLKTVLNKYDKYARQDAFAGNNVAEFEEWRKKTRATLKELLGWKYMESCPLNPVITEKEELEEGILREKVIIQVEPDTYMTMYILIPPKKEPDRDKKRNCFLALPGHQGAGKYSVAGCYEIPAVKKMIDYYHYDYGMQLARLGYVAICPDCRGFGERRDEALQKDSEGAFLNSSCFQLAHMAEPLGMTVAGMCTWDVCRLLDYIEERNAAESDEAEKWNMETIGCLGFSGGGMQTLWAAALDDRIRQVVISGYLYGYKDSLLILNGNCSCNYVPNLWEHFDMGDIAALIAPRPLLIQSCREDHLNGPRGLVNVLEQLEIVKNAYSLYGCEEWLLHDVREGDHCFYWEPMEDCLKKFFHRLVR